MNKLELYREYKELENMHMYRPREMSQEQKDRYRELYIQGFWKLSIDEQQYYLNNL